MSLSKSTLQRLGHQRGRGGNRMQVWETLAERYDKDKDGNLEVVVADKMPDVESALVKRYGDKVPELTREIARSALAPAARDVAIKLHRVRKTYYWTSGYWGGHRSHHGYRLGGGFHHHGGHHGRGGHH